MLFLCLNILCFLSQKKKENRRLQKRIGEIRHQPIGSWTSSQKSINYCDYKDRDRTRKGCQQKCKNLLISQTSLGSLDLSQRNFWVLPNHASLVSLITWRNDNNKFLRVWVLYLLETITLQQKKKTEEKKEFCWSGGGINMLNLELPGRLQNNRLDFWHWIAMNLFLSGFDFEVINEY